MGALTEGLRYVLKTAIVHARKDFQPKSQSTVENIKVPTLENMDQAQRHVELRDFLS